MKSMTEADRENLKVDDFITRGAAGPVPRLYGDALVASARRDDRIVCLCADLAGATETDLFRDTIPERFFHTGIAEANMIGMAAGMARGGDIPFVHTFCVFATRRCFDQIAMQVAYPQLPVKIIGFLPGLTTLLGVSHQAIEDIALMRALPNMTVIEPDGSEQMAGVVDAALSIPGPVYIRLKRADGPVAAHHQARPVLPGKAEIVRQGSDGVIIACGLMVQAAKAAADQLASEGIDASVLNLSTIKPLDAETITKFAKQAKFVVTAENHSIVGGLGSAVAEVLCESGVPARFRRIGIRDTFAEGGSTPYLLSKYGLTAGSIVETVHSLLE
jgi:transketolase